MVQAADARAVETVLLMGYVRFASGSLSLESWIPPRSCAKVLEFTTDQSSQTNIEPMARSIPRTRRDCRRVGADVLSPAVTAQVRDVAGTRLAKGTLATPRARLRCSRRRCATATLRKPSAGIRTAGGRSRAGEIAAVVSARPGWRDADMQLTHALRAALPPGATAGDARAELMVSSPGLCSRWPAPDPCSNWSTAGPLVPTSPRFGSAPAGASRAVPRHT